MSIADRTACSASSEYGGCRSRNGSRLSDGAIEYSTDELDIFPSGAFPRRIAQQCRRMIGDDQRHAMKAMHLASEFSDRQLRLQKSLRCEHPKSKDCFWPNEFNLTEQIWAAGGYFVGHRVAVARRAMLQHVADERVFALQVDCRENFGEQLTGGADERPARFILGRSRRFSDNHETGGRTALARHGVGGGRIERAARARPDRLSYRLQRVELCERAAEQLA